MKLYLIPSLLSQESLETVSPQVKHILETTSFYLVEHLKTARRFIRKVLPKRNIDELSFFVLNKRSTEAEVGAFFKEIPKEENVGVISEAGCPCIADPGNLAVSYAHQKGIEVLPLVGASSILMALMASGMNGQSFVFHGYLPIKQAQRIKKLQEIERDALKKQQTQIFMEAPYRNNQLLATILKSCHSNTKLCIASNITAPNQFIQTKTIQNWKSKIPDLHKKATIFVLA